MEEWLIYLTRHAIVVINGFALIVILYGAAEAFITAVGRFFSRSAMTSRFPWLRFGRWLVAGLTFQLAADIIETAITPNWEDIARLAAIAVVRTFLNFFLERDLAEVRERGEESESA